MPQQRGVGRFLSKLLGGDAKSREFPGSAAYWEERYRKGGTSGAGSYAEFAEFKAEVLNEFVASSGVRSVIEFGCGDGNQLALARYPRYDGVDVSPAAVARCRERFAADATKSFGTTAEYDGRRADLALSLDVVYHLVEDDVFERYMRTLFAAAERFVIVYASDFDSAPGATASHVRHRKFTLWVAANAPEWRLARHVPNRHPRRDDAPGGTPADFFVFERAPHGR